MYYHFSEDPDIKTFVPRPAKSFPHLPPVVWAIDEAQAVNYCLPRDCPRVIYWKSDSLTAEDEKELFSNTEAEKIIAVENAWLPLIQRTKLYVYTFEENGFERFAEAPGSGYYLSHETVVPLAVDPVGDLLARITRQPVDLRFTPDLEPIKKRVAASTAEFSIIRYRNAEKMKNTI